MKIQKQNRTFNAQHSTSNGGKGNEWSALNVGRWMLNVECSSVLALAMLAVTICSCVSVNAQTLLLQGATIHTVSGPTIARGDVLIQDGKIRGVFDTNQPSRQLYPSDATIIDLKGQHLYPGLIALDTALGLVEINGVRATRDQFEVGDYVPDVQSWIAVNPDSELLPVARANGVAFFEPTPQGGVVAGQSALVALTGWTTEEMAFKKPIALHVFWPNLGLNLTPKEKAADKAKWKSPEDQAKERIEKLKALADFFEEAHAYAKAKEAGAKGAIALRTNPPWEAMLPFVRGQLPITIHADGEREIVSAVGWATTNHYRIILAGGRDAWRVAGLLATNQIPVIYENVFTQPVRDTDGYDTQFKAAEVLRQAGVKVVFSTGTDSASLVKNLPYEAAQAVAFGFPEDEAIKGLTLYPAQLAGVAERVGSIESGKDATLFVADGDILDIRSHVLRMWIAGKEVSLDDRHKRLYEKYRNRPKAP
jgi:imidazolonepropionase-like amidohydrolase